MSVQALLHGRRAAVRVGAAALLAALASLVGTGGGAANAGVATDGDGLSVGVTPDHVDVVLGEQADLRVTVSNPTADPTPHLVVHLDVTDPAETSSVDPEDWTSTLTQAIGVVGAGESASVSWTIQPISGGTFVAYVVALSPDDAAITTSNRVLVEVADERSLNPGGILPVAVIAPALVGALLLDRIRLARRRRPTA